jgi:hypothetical protein
MGCNPLIPARAHGVGEWPFYSANFFLIVKKTGLETFLFCIEFAAKFLDFRQFHTVDFSPGPSAFYTAFDSDLGTSGSTYSNVQLIITVIHFILQLITA